MKEQKPEESTTMDCSDLAPANPAASAQSVFLVRHGVRADECPKSKWRPTAHAKRYDTPITDEGKVHARQHAAQYLSEFHSQKPFHCVYTSPFRRCVETAAEIATELQLPIKIVMSLGGCAAAAEMLGIDKLPFDDQHMFAAEYPHLTFLPTDHHTSDAANFLSVCERIAQEQLASHGDAVRVMIVAHREGLRLFSKGRNIPYCGSFNLHFAGPQQWAVQTASFPWH